MIQTEVGEGKGDSVSFPPLPPPEVRSRTDSLVLPRDTDVCVGESTDVSPMVFYIFQCASLAHLNICFNDLF